MVKSTFILSLALIVFCAVIVSGWEITAPTNLSAGKILPISLKGTEEVKADTTVTLDVTFDPIHDYDYDEIFNTSDVTVTGPSLEQYQCTGDDGKVIATAAVQLGWKLEVNYLGAVTNDKAVHCNFRLNSQMAYTGNMIVTVVSTTDSATVQLAPAPETAPTFTAKLLPGDSTIGSTKIAIPNELAQFDISKMVVTYTNLPPNYLGQIKFGIVSFDSITVPDELQSPTTDAVVDAFKTQATQTLTSITTALMGYGYQQTDAKCSSDVRLVVQGSKLFILTGTTPVDGECHLPFSRTSIGLLGVVNASDKIAQLFDVATLFRKVVDIRVTIGTWTTSINGNQPLFPEVQTHDVTPSEENPGELDMTITTNIPKDDPDFEILSISGISDAIKKLLKGDYGSIYDLITGNGKETNPETTEMIVAKVSNSNIRNKRILSEILTEKTESTLLSPQGIFDWIPGFKKTKLAIKSGWSSIKLRIPTGEDLDPINIDVSIAGKKFQMVYQPIAQFNSVTVQSVTDTEMNFKMVFQNKNAAFGQEDLPLFNASADTKVEYAIIPSMVRVQISGSSEDVFDSNMEVRDSTAPLPECTIDHAGLTIESRTLPYHESVDKFMSSYLVVTGTTKVSDTWELTCVQKLNPNKKPIIPSTENDTPALQFSLQNRYLQNLFGLINGKQTHNIIFDKLPLGVVTWTKAEIKELTGINLLVHYQPSINTPEEFSTFITGLVAYLNLGNAATDWQDVTPFDEFKPSQVFLPTNKSPYENSFGAHHTSIVLNAWDNKYMESWSRPGSTIRLTILPESGKSFSQSQVNVWTKPEFNPLWRLASMQVSTSAVFVNSPASYLDPTAATDYAITLASAYNAPCYSSVQCPTNGAVCVSGICTEHLLVPAAVKATLPAGFQLDDPYFAFHSASTGIYTLFAVALALISAVFLV